MANTGASRRQFLNVLTNWLLGIIGLLATVLTLGFVWTLLRWIRNPDLQDMGSLTSFPRGEWCLRMLVHENDGNGKRVHPIFVRRQDKGDQRIAVLSMVCPHRGCFVDWYPDQSRFIC